MRRRLMGHTYMIHTEKLNTKRCTYLLELYILQSLPELAVAAGIERVQVPADGATGQVRWGDSR